MCVDDWRSKIGQLLSLQYQTCNVLCVCAYSSYTCVCMCVCVCAALI